MAKISNFILLKSELFKIASRPRNYIGFGALLLIIGLVELALYIDGKQYLSFITQQLEQTFMLEGNLLNGSLVCFIILQTLIVQMPLLVALVTGDLVSGEAANGTLRLLMTRPISRSQLLSSKIMAGSVYTFLLILWLGILAFGGGLFLFGTGDLIVLKSEELVILRANDVIWRFFAAFAVAFISLSVVTAYSIMLSCFVNNSIGPIIASMATLILFTIIGTLDFPLFEIIKPFLFTTHMVVWRNLFDDPIPWQAIFTSIGVMVAYIALFYTIAYYHFTKKDILV